MPEKKKKRVRKISPTTRSMEYLAEQGWLCEKVENWIPGTKIRRDLFGVFDILAIRGKETMGVQVTTGDNLATRTKKIVESAHLQAIVAAGWKVKVHGWRRWKKSGEWVLREVEM